MLPLPKRPHVFHSILIGCMHKEIFQFFSLFFKSVLPFSVRNFSQLQFSLFYGCLDTFSCLGTGRHDNCGESILAGEIPLKAQGRLESGLAFIFLFYRCVFVFTKFNQNISSFFLVELKLSKWVACSRIFHPS